MAGRAQSATRILHPKGPLIMPQHRLDWRIRTAIAGAVLIVLGGACALVILAVTKSTNSGFEDLSNASAVIAAAEKETPLPPGSRYDTEPFHTQQGTNYQAGYFLSVAQQEAQCKWYMYFIKTAAANDVSGEHLAESTFTSMKSWALYTDTDPSTRNFYDQIVTAAELGDPSGLQTFIAQNCQHMTP
jgi:hypothetical protein